MYLWTALRVFFRVLFNKVLATDVAKILDGSASAAPVPIPSTTPGAAPPATLSKPKPAAKPTPPRSDALTLLSTLQREGRLVDFLREDLSAATDAQIGAVARDLQRDCRAAVERFFALAPLCEQPEGSRIELPAGYDPARYHVLGTAPRSDPRHSENGSQPLTGDAGTVDGEPESDGLDTAVRGVVLHPGWKATRCELPIFTGSETAQLVIAPCEVERR